MQPDAFKQLQEVCKIGFLFTKVMLTPQYVLFASILYYYYRYYCCCYYY